MPLARYYNACGVLMQAGVPKAAELLVRSIGNDQDMFGFILLGAVQDSRTPTVTLGTRDGGRRANFVEHPTQSETRLP